MSAPGEIVYWVEWVDSATLNRGEWTDLQDEGMDTSRCTSSGFLVRDEPTFIVLAASLDADGRGAGLIAIPRPAITLIKAWTPAGTP